MTKEEEKKKRAEDLVKKWSLSGLLDDGPDDKLEPAILIEPMTHSFFEPNL